MFANDGGDRIASESSMTEIVETLRNPWGPALEITILSIGIYYVFIFLRGTRGWPVVIGFLLMLGLMFLSTLLQLQVLGLLLRTFFAFSAVAVLVIFQPEFRRLLSELGNLPLFTTTREQRENIEVIVQAVERMSDVGIGVLIAIEQSIPLQGIVESGVVVDCEATPEMLESIFFPNNALHDGGVIIKSGRIAFAACIFPLTQRQDLNPSLGTRHRAAIGLTEETDAVVVIVSEETGAISYAHKGKLMRGISVEELRAFLSSIFISRPRSKNFREWLRPRKSGQVESTPAVASESKVE